MKIERVEWRRFHIPFRAPYVTGAGSVEAREGFLVWLHLDGGLTGVGEASLLPEDGLGRLQELAEQIRVIARRVTGQSLDALPGLLASEQPSQVEAAVACSFDTAALDAAGRAAGLPVARLLAERVRSTVEVNAMIGGKPLGMAVAEAAAASQEGYRTIKLKVGIGTHVATEARRVAAVRQTIGPGLKLRLDANGAWSVDDALRAIEAFAPYDVEFIEQPVVGDLKALKAVRSGSAIAVGADEDAASLDAVRRIIEMRAADYLVLKPTRLGGLRAAREAIGLAEAAAVKTIVTTSIDTGVGTAAALQLAATLPAGSPACGLATAALLESDLLVAPLPIVEGRMPLPSAAGLGVELSQEALDRYCGPVESV